MILTRMDTPGPAVEVLVDSALPGTGAVTVWRTAAGREFRVRGMVRIPYLGGAARIDYDVPLGVPVEYRAECFDSNGDPLGFASPASITVDADRSWLHNPLAPSGAVAVSALSTSARTIDRPTVSEAVFPIGRRVGVVVGSVRRGLSAFRFDVYSDSLDQADQIQALIGEDGANLPPVLCVRNAGTEARMRIPKPLYLHVASIIEDDVSVRLGKETTRQLMQGDEVSPPAPSLFIPLLRRIDVDAFYATRAALDAAYLNRLGIDRDYGLAGFAG